MVKKYMKKIDDHIVSNIPQIENLNKFMVLIHLKQVCYDVNVNIISNTVTVITLGG